LHHIRATPGKRRPAGLASFRARRTRRPALIGFVLRRRGRRSGMTSGRVSPCARIPRGKLPAGRRILPAGAMNNFYANITVSGPAQPDVVAYLNAQRHVAYVSATVKGATVVFHEDFATQEALAAGLSAHFRCPALLAMVFGGTVLLYHLYAGGEQVDAYVSAPHEGLELDGPAPEGNAETLCAAFGIERRVSSVGRVLTRPTKLNTDYALAVNRHGELLRALNLPLFAAGAGFASIESGELPAGPGFDPGTLVRTGA
jgi:hypothetical protein